MDAETVMDMAMSEYYSWCRMGGSRSAGCTEATMVIKEHLTGQDCKAALRSLAEKIRESIDRGRDEGEGKIDDMLDELEQ